MIKTLFNKLIKPLYFSIKLAFRYKDPRFIFSCSISRNLPCSTIIPHPIGIVIGKGNGVSIGEECTIMQGVTIGVRRLGDIKGPKVGNRVFIGVNTVIVGEIVIGEGAKIGPNCFIDFDIPPGSHILPSESRRIK
jgi:serine O-acetyltransferase